MGKTENSIIKKTVKVVGSVIGGVVAMVLVYAFSKLIHAITGGINQAFEQLFRFIAGNWLGIVAVTAAMIIGTILFLLVWNKLNKKKKKD